MKIKIFQINLERDKNRVVFESLKTTEQFQGNAQIDSSLYDEVFSGDVGCNNLEEVFQKFNTDYHPAYRGRSLSVSDVVQTENGCYFCDSFGFASVDFDPTQTQKPGNLLKTIMIEPNKSAYETEIENSLKGLQRAIGGKIEGTYPFDDNTMIYSNAESKLNGMDGNRSINGELYAGPMMIVGIDGKGNNCSLTEMQLQKYTEQFKTPEQYTHDDVEDSINMTFQSL